MIRTPEVIEQHMSDFRKDHYVKFKQVNIQTHFSEDKNYIYLQKELKYARELAKKDKEIEKLEAEIDGLCDLMGFSDE